ncbi:MAG: hypothetical protein OXE84_06810 [Rhodobacteraceae bacterium]|nr:hypothetical protein [Paracoccaceae bacterium]
MFDTAVDPGQTAERRPREDGWFPKEQRQGAVEPAGLTTPLVDLPTGWHVDLSTDQPLHASAILIIMSRIATWRDNRPQIQ